MALLLDVLIIFIFLLSIITCTKKGFIRSIMGVAVVILAIIGSIILSPSVADYLNNKYIDKKVTGIVEDALDSLTKGVDSMKLSDLFDESSGALKDVIKRFNVDFDTVNSYYKNSSEINDDNISEKISQYIAKDLSLKISKAVAFAAVFIGLIIVLTVLMFIINLICKIPILSRINSSLGFIFGIVKGLLYSWGFSVIFCKLVPYLYSLYPDKIPGNVIDSTIIVRFLGYLDITKIL